jgi:O-antigen biosynthesis protein
MNLTIVISCLNLWSKFTKPCLDSIRSSHPYRIILLDNGSTDETPEQASNLVSANFQLRRFETNIGTSRSWNYGIADGFETGADYVAVLNNDILLHPNCLDCLVERIARDDVAMVTALDVRGELAAPEEVFYIPASAKAEVPESGDANFSAFLIGRRCWDLVGRFDEKFHPAYFEDNDYHYRLLLTGLRAIVYPPAMFYHYGSRTQYEAKSTPVVSGSAFDANRNYYIRKWGGPPGVEQFRKPFVAGACAG